jgi:hypothetical protein
MINLDRPMIEERLAPARKVIRSRDLLGAAKITCLGHDDVFAAQTVIRVRVVEEYGGNGDVRVCAQVGYCCDFRGRLETRHEAPCDARDDLTSVGQRDEISLVKAIM